MKVFALLLLLCASVFSQAQAPSPANVDQNLLSAIRKELACDCGCGMTVQDCLGGMICSESRAYSNEVVGFLQAGKTREQILQAMVAKYGEKILSAPTKEGFNLTAWAFPFLALLLGGVLVWRVVAKWKTQSPAPASTPEPQRRTENDAYSQRFEDEFKQFSN